MESKKITPEIKALQERFFEAINILIESKKIKSLQAFCSENGLHRAKYSNIRNHNDNPAEGTGYKLIDLDALCVVVKEYKVSAHWLITGEGGMFDKQKKGGK